MAERLRLLTSCAHGVVAHALPLPTAFRFLPSAHRAAQGCGCRGRQITVGGPVRGPRRAPVEAPPGGEALTPDALVAAIHALCEYRVHRCPCACGCDRRVACDCRNCVGVLCARCHVGVVRGDDACALPSAGEADG